MFWKKRAVSKPAQAAVPPSDSIRPGNRNRDEHPEFLISLEQLLIANMLWMAL